MDQHRINEKSKAAWIFGSLTLVFLMVAYFLTSGEATQAQHKILGNIAAICSALFAFFYTGSFSLLLVGKENRFGRLTLRVTGSAVVFFVVLWWWHSPLSIIKNESNVFAEVLKLFEAKVGFPQYAGKEKFSPTDYSRAVRDFIKENALSEKHRNALLAKIDDAVSEIWAKGTKGKTVRVLRRDDLLERAAALVEKRIPLEEPIAPPPTSPIPPATDGGGIGGVDTIFDPVTGTFADSLLASMPRNLHGAWVFVILRGPNGADSARVGEDVSALVRLQHVDRPNDTIIMTNFALQFGTGTGRARTLNLLPKPVTFRKFGDQVRLSYTFPVFAGDGPEFEVNAVASGVDLHDGEDGNGTEQSFMISFPARIKVE